ncbi:glutaredoxin family protein [Hippea alviniae]|uniref:glutaredoxin family protein n=1 Tax=Hippea alviniae TaxID=1279027 RepID=UPI0003B652E6|nr:glutaredoxin family protein [Hippea alviniae]
MATKKPEKQPRVVVFSTPSCPWCNRVKQYLRQHGIKFKDVDVSRDRRAAEDMVRRTGQTGVPVVLIGSKAIVGFDKPKIDKYLGLR